VNRFAGKVAAITGAGSGIGRALALELGRRGCHLALSDVSDSELAVTAQTAQNLGVQVTSAHVDVTDRTAVDAWAARVRAEHGSVHFIFNNAGMASSSTLHQTPHQDFERIMSVNFWGVVHGTQAFLPHLEASGEGHVVNISSLFGLVAFPGTGAYNTSKFAVRGYTETLRMELDMLDIGVSATCVHPGGVRTNITRGALIHDSARLLFGPDSGASRDRFDKLLATTNPERAARCILAGVAKNRRRVVIGRDAHFLHSLQRLFGASYQAIVAGVVRWSVQRQSRLQAAGEVSRSERS